MSSQLVIPEDTIRQQAILDGVTHFTTGIAIMRDGKVLVVRRLPDDYPGGMYELPGGGVDDGETFAQSAIREVQEETGLRVTKILGTFDGFDYQTSSKPKVRQINFTVEVAPGEVVLEPTEHDAYAWITAGDIDALHTSDKMKVCLRVVLGVT